MGWELGEQAVWWLAALSVGSVLISLVAIPWFIARMPTDYFCHSRREPLYAQYRHPLVGLAAVALKNLIGALLVLFGILMILTPGQGLLTIIIGLMLLNFPGKYRLERWLVTRNGALNGINWLRRKLGKPPLEAPAAE